ncbi:J domain-containing protein [Dokdonella sp.]|uniref:J domain-containing protein n=1 Tax=Dokdonella sp. TaxID=2291710 RepID=UPI002F41EA0E
MLDKADFFLLYQQLGLKPGCTPEELKTAYRRRIAELHPDRHGADADPADAERLQELTAAYSAASAFHRRYGRLPGGMHSAPRAAMPRAGGVPPSMAPRPTRAGSRGWLWLALALGLLWAAWSGGLFGGAADSASDPSPGRLGATSRPPVEAPAALIVVGTDAATVRALEGRPVMEIPQRWDYGPSWIAFVDGKVSDWYSSKLRPLKVASAHPPPSEPAAR